MNVRQFEETDYEDIKSWWIKQDCLNLPLNALTENGFLAVKDNEKIAAVWGYRTDSPIYMMAWLVGNPEVSWEVRAEGIKMVIDSCSFWAKECGAKIIYTTTNNDRLFEKLKSNNFIVTDQNVKTLIRNV